MKYRKNKERHSEWRPESIKNQLKNNKTHPKSHPEPKVRRGRPKTSKTPRRPFEKERIDGELKLVGEYGLRNKRELWRTQLALAKIRKSARALLTLEPKDPKRMFEAPALLRRLQRYGLVEDSEMDLDSVLQMTTQRLLERRLQTHRSK